MLCPKCQFISFDHLSACGKCHHDLSGIGTVLHGAAASISSRLFLGGVLKTFPATEPESVVIPAVTPAEPMGFAPEPEPLPLEQHIELEVSEISAAEQSPGLEFTLDETPPLDTTDINAITTEDKELPPPEAEAITLLEIESEEESGQPVPPPEATAETADQTLEIDALNLTLDTPVEEPVHAETQTEEEQVKPLTVDLNEIDLSDLMHAQDKTPSDEAASGTEPADSGLDIEDTMDLSLFSGEGNELPTVDELLSDASNGLEPIDLTLMDEALVELTMDPDRKEVGQAIPASGQTKEPELSMEESDK